MLNLADGRGSLAVRVGNHSRIWSALTAVCLGVGTLFLAVALRSYANDDPYITYRYARNLARGNGLVYNVGLNVLSTTTPLYTLILALGYFVWRDLPVFSNALNAASLGLSSILLYRMATDKGERFAGLVSGALTLFFPLILSTFGAETAFHVLLIIASFYLYSRERLSMAAATAGLATLTRGDGVLVAIAVAIHFFWTRRKLPLRPALIYLVVIFPWYLYSWLHFGSPFPATLQAKLHQSQMAVTIGFFRGIAYWVKGHARLPVYWLYLPLMLVGAAGLKRRHRWAIPLLLWMLLYLFGYTVLNVPRYHWYYGPLIPPLMLLVGLGVAELLRRVSTGSRWRAVGGLAATVLLIWPNLQSCMWLVRHSPDGRAQLYKVVGNRFKQHTPPEATVGTLEVGILGYFSECSLIDFAGLIQPDIAEQVEAGYEDAAVWAIKTYQPDYLVFHPGWFPTMVVSPWFTERYQAVKQFESEQYPASPMVVYTKSRYRE